MTAAIELRDVHKSLRGTPVLTGLNLRVHPGTCHALVGLNGAGTVSYTHLTLPTSDLV